MIYTINGADAPAISGTFMAQIKPYSSCYPPQITVMCHIPKGKTKTQQGKAMTEYTRTKARQFRIPETSTPEDLECRFSAGDGKTIRFGNLTIIAGYFYQGRGENSHYWAAYRNGGGIEDPTELEAVSNGLYEDDGHALQDAFNWAAQWA